MSYLLLLISVLTRLLLVQKVVPTLKIVTQKRPGTVELRSTLWMFLYVQTSLPIFCGIEV